MGVFNFIVMKNFKITLLFSLVLLASNFLRAQQGLEGLIIEKYYQANAEDVANAAANGASNALTTNTVVYRVYVDMLPGYKFIQLFGNAAHPMSVSTTTNFYNDPSYGVALNPGTISTTNIAKNTAMLDSWFTTGGVANGKVGVMKSEDTDGALSNAQGILLNNPTNNCYGSPLQGSGAADGFASTTTGTYLAPTVLGLGVGNAALAALAAGSGSTITISNGSISALGGLVGPTSTNRVLVGQFSTNGVLSLNFNVQIKNTLTGVSYTYVYSNATGSEILNSSLSFSNAQPVVTANTNILCTGVPVSLTTNATGSLQWYKTTSATVAPTAIAGATSASYTPTAVGLYSVKNDICAVPSSNTITITQGTITSGTPSAAAVGQASACVGGTVTLSASTSVTNPSYQWYKGTTAVAGATSSTLTLSPMSTSLAGAYNVKVAAAGQCLSAASSSVTVTAVALPATPTVSLVGSTYPVLCGASTNGTYTTGVTLKSSIAPTASSVTPVVATLQWYKDGQAIAGATAQNYVATQAGSYQVQVTNPTTGCTGLMSAATVVSVGVVPTAPVATASGSALLCGTAAQVTLSSSVAASGTATTPGSITLQWYKSVTNATTGVTTVTTIPAASFGTNQAILLAGSTPTGSTNALSGITYSAATATGSYTVKALLVGGCPSAASNAISATYSALPAVSNATTTTAGASTLLCGSPISLKSSVAASATVLVQWYKDGQLISGATATNYIASEAGSYTVVTTNVAGCSAAAGTALVLTQGVAAATPVITASGSTAICGLATASVQLTSSSAAQAGTTTLQWYKNGTAVTGGTATTLSVLNTAANAGSYTVKVLSQTGACPSALSAATSITTGTAPTTVPTVSTVTSTGAASAVTALSNTTQTIYLKSSVAPVTATATVAPVILKWYKNGVEMTSTVNSGLTNQTIAVTSAGSYTVRAFYGTSVCEGTMSVAKVITGTSPLGMDLNNNEAHEDNTSKLNEELVWDAAVSRNPFEQYVTIRLNSASESEVELTMIDAMGKVVSHEVAKLKELGSMRLGEGLTPGMYMINIRQDENIKTIRVIKQ